MSIPTCCYYSMILKTIRGDILHPAVNIKQIHIDRSSSTSTAIYMYICNPIATGRFAFLGATTGSTFPFVQNTGLLSSLLFTKPLNKTIIFILLILLVGGGGIIDILL